jgi:hypothetical protein
MNPLIRHRRRSGELTVTLNSEAPWECPGRFVHNRYR